MGGSGVALGNDSAAPFLNPATVARIDQTTLALSSQLIELRSRTISSFRQPAPVPDGDLRLDDADVSDIGVDFIPTAVCYFQNLGEAGAQDRTRAHTLSLCIGATERSDISSLGDAASTANDATRIDTASSLRASWNRLAVSLSWGHYFAEWFAGGVSIVFEQAEQNVALSTSTLFESLADETAVSNAFNLSRTGSSSSFRGEVGGLFRLAGRYYVGVSARTPSWAFASSYASTQLREGTGGNSVRRVDEGSFEAAAPLRIALGLGYESSRLQLELDLFFFLPQSRFLELDIDREVTTIDEAGNVERQPSQETIRDGSNFVVNMSAGARYVLTPRWSLLGGVQTDLSLLDDRSDVAVDSRVAVTSADSVFGSVGVGYRGRLGNFVSGLRFGYREGEILAVDGFRADPVVNVVEDQAFSALLVIYGEVDFGAVARNLTPGFLKKTNGGDGGP
jgi:hypothetical protein